MSSRQLFVSGAIAQPDKADSVLAHFRNRQAPAYLFDPATVAALNDRARRYPEYLDALFDRADHAVDGEFILAGNSPAGSYLRCGPEIDWHHTPNGDREGLFTLNRHFWFFDLARAFRLSGDRRYLDALLEQLLHWIDSCPAPTDGETHFHDFSPWKLLNGAIRITDAWLPAYFLVIHDPALPADVHLRWLEAIAEHARILSEHIFDRTHNHTVEEMGALLEISLCFPELAGTDAQRDTAVAVLEECMAEQVFDDGVHFEATPAYHKHSMEWFVLPFLVARRNGLRFSDEYEKKLAGMAAFSAASSFPDGSTVPFGDSDRNAMQRGVSDRGFLSGLTMASFGPVAGVVETTAHPAFLWTIGSDDPAEQAPGGTGADSSATSASSAHSTQIARPPRYSLSYPDGGFYAFTDAEAHAAGETATFYAALRNGPTNHGHPHADLLSLLLYARGMLWLTDTGKYTYNECPERRHLKGTVAHNTLRVDGQDQTPYRDRMSFATELSYRTRTFVEQPDYTFFDGEHYGYRRLPMAVDHRRQVIWIRGAGVLVIDRVTGSGAHLYEQCWHIPGTGGARLDGAPLDSAVTREELRRPHASELSVRLNGEAAAERPGAGLFTLTREPGVLVLVPALRGSGTHGDETLAQLSQTWHAPAYGEQVSGLLLRYSRRAVPPVFMATWIELADNEPDRSASAGPTGYAVSVETAAEADGAASDAGTGGTVGAEDLDTQSTPRRSPEERAAGHSSERLVCRIRRPGGDYRIVVDDEVHALEQM